MSGVIDNLRRDLAQAERFLHYARACQEILGTEAWKCIEDRMKAEREDMMQRLAYGEFSVEGTHTLRGAIKMLDLLVSVPRLNARQISTLEQKVSHLRAKLDQRKKADLDREVPGWKEHVEDIRNILQGVTSEAQAFRQRPPEP